MPRPLELHPDRLFPNESNTRAIARSLYQSIKSLPIISPHGHTDPAWFANNLPFANAAELLIIPDHYVLRMLYSQGISLDRLGVSRVGEKSGANPRDVWRLFAQHYHLFRATPSRIWLDWVFKESFSLEVALDESTADYYYDHISQQLASPEFRPRSLFERYNIEVLATTESPLDDLRYHQAILKSGWNGRVITAFRPDPVVDPEFNGFLDHLSQLGNITRYDTFSYQGYLKALADRRSFFKSLGATSTDHGHPTAATADLSPLEAEKLFHKVSQSSVDPVDAELFRAHMLTVMAGMSVEDNLVMQLHPGSYRNHNKWLFDHFGRDKGADIPKSTPFVEPLRPLLNKYGNDPRFNLILFTLDETAYTRELAPIAGHYPSVKLGPAWWFHDSPEGMRRFRRQVTETAGFYNTVGFNDDTRAFLSIPARHDVARRIDCGFLAEMVAEHQLNESEAHELAQDLSYNFAKQAYRL